MKATSTIAPLLFIGSVFGCSSGSALPDMYICETSVKVLSCESPPNSAYLQCVFENIHPSLQIDGYDFKAWAYDKNGVRLADSAIVGTGKIQPGQKAIGKFSNMEAPKKVIICSVDPQGPLSKMLDIQPIGKK